MDGDRDLGVIPELGDAAAEMIAHGEGREIVESHFVLGGDPFGHLFGIEIFHPAVGGGDFCAMVVVNDVVFGSWRVGNSGMGGFLS